MWQACEVGKSGSPVNIREENLEFITSKSPSAPVFPSSFKRPPEMHVSDPAVNENRQDQTPPAAAGRSKWWMQPFTAQRASLDGAIPFTTTTTTTNTSTTATALPFAPPSDGAPTDKALRAAARGNKGVLVSVLEQFVPDDVSYGLLLQYYSQLLLQDNMKELIAYRNISASPSSASPPSSSSSSLAAADNRAAVDGFVSPLSTDYAEAGTSGRRAPPSSQDEEECAAMATLRLQTLYEALKMRTSWKPASATLNVLLCAYAQVNDLPRCGWILSDMRDHAVLPSVTALYALLQAYVHAGNVRDFDNTYFAIAQSLSKAKAKEAAVSHANDASVLLQLWEAPGQLPLHSLHTVGRRMYLSSHSYKQAAVCYAEEVGGGGAREPQVERVLGDNGFFPLAGSFKDVINGGKRFNGRNDPEDEGHGSGGGEETPQATKL